MTIRKKTVKRKWGHLFHPERKVCGFFVVGKSVEEISVLVDIPVSEVDCILEDKAKKPTTPLVVEPIVDFDSISKSLADIGEKNLTAIIRKRAMELRKHTCMDD